MPASEQDKLASLSASHDIITLGMAADDVRRGRHGVRTTFVRVARVGADVGAEALWPSATGEIRIAGTPPSLAAAVERVNQVAARANGLPLSGFSLADLELVAGREGVTLRALLEELRAAGLELVAEAPFDRLQNARRSVEEVNIAGLALARLTIDQSPPVDPLAVLRDVAELQRAVAVVRAFAPLPQRTNHAAPTTGYDDVRRVALARIVCDNVASIQVD